MIENIQSQDLPTHFQNGKSKLEAGNWEAALNDFRTLKQQALGSADTLYLALALDYEGQSLMYEKTISGYKLAKLLFEEAITYYKILKSSRGLYRSYQKLGIINRDTKQPKLGKKNLHQSLFYARKLTNKPDSATLELGTAYKWLGTTYNILEEYNSSLHYLRASYEVMQQGIDSASCKNYYRAQSLTNLISTELNKNMIFEANNHLLDLENYVIQDTCLNNFGYILYAQRGRINRVNKKYREAIEDYNHALNFCKKIKRKNCKAEILNNIGVLQYRNGDLDASIATFKKIDGLLQNNDDINYKKRIRLNNTLGTIYAQKNDYDNAELYYSNAIDIAKEYLSNTAQLATIQRNYGTFLMRQEKVKQALEVGHQSLITNSTNFRPLDISENPTTNTQYLDREEFFESLIFKGYAARLLIDEDFLYYGAMAISIFDVADSILTQLKLSLSNEEDKIRLVSQTNFKELYFSGTKACFKMYDHTADKKYLEKAFSYMEKSKSFTLFEEINLGTTYQNSGATKLQVQSFKNNIAKIEQLQQSLDTLNINNASQLYENTYNRLKTLRDSVDYFRSNYTQNDAHIFLSQIPSINEVQSKLEENQAIFNFLEVRDSLYLLVIKKNEIEGITYRQTKEFKQLIKNYHAAVDSFYLPYQFYPVSYQLYQKLIEPVKKYLSGISQLIIIPHKGLDNVYFDALITHSSEQKISFSSFKYLIDDFDIKYHYSSSLWYISENTQKDFDYTYIGLAPFAQTSTNITIKQQEISLTQLSATKDEVNYANQIFDNQDVKVLIDKDAYIGHPSQNILSSRIIHYAMHSEFIDKEVYYFLLDAFGKPIYFTKDDYYLYPSLDCNLLIFSSCNSGQGEYIQGEGLMSIIRPILYQGIPNILVTLNLVRDNSSSELIQYFLKNISEGDNYLKSINKAKRELKNQDTFPAAWASYILIGVD